jgi:hypothetical protein
VWLEAVPVGQDNLAGEFVTPIVGIVVLCPWLNLQPNLIENFL